MIAAVLTAAVIWCLFLGLLPMPLLLVVSVGTGLLLALLGKHAHRHMLVIDSFAQTSRLKTSNPTLKFWTVLLLMVLCVASQSPLVGVFLALSMGIMTVAVGGIKLGEYVRMLALPLSFLMISGLVLLFDVTAESVGVLSISLFGIWLSITSETQALAALVMARAFGAVSCLYFLSLTTPMSGIIGVLRRIHCPGVLIDLMYLIYRYIFILLSMYYSMYDAAKSRMGYAGLTTSLRTTGSLYSNLLARSYRQANQNFDAMESRCYDSEIRFLENREKATGMQIIGSFSFIVLTLTFSVVMGL